MKHSTIMLAAWALVGCLSNLAWAQQGAETRPVSAATSPAVLLEKGIYTEETVGDLEAAIAVYRKIINNAKANRKYVAEAHFRLGMCLLKKKKPAEAEAIFRELAEKYSDQKALSARARKQIALSRKRITGAELAAIVDKAVTTISTCGETDPRVKKSLATLEGLDEARTVKAIVKFLSSEKNTIRRSAIYILWRGEFSSIAPAEAALMKLCEHSESMTRGMAALALGGRKIDAAFKPLCDMTLKDTSQYTRRCAAYALGLLGDDRAKGVLEKALKDKNEMVRNNAEAALTMLAMGKAGSAPVVVGTTPACFAGDVPASLDSLTVTFNQQMLDKHWAWVQRYKDKYPKTTGKPSFDVAQKTCTLPVKLEPGKVYWIEFNSPPYTAFRSVGGAIARRHALVFATKSADGKATKIPDDLVAFAKKINARAPGGSPAAGKAQLPLVSDRDKLEAENLAAKGWQLWNLRKLAEAEAKFKQAVEKDPTNAGAWNGYGWAQMNQNKLLNAKRSFEKCLAIEPKHAGALNGLGWIAKGQGKTQEAIAYWEKAVAAIPTATAALAGLSTTYIDLKNYDKAIGYLYAWYKVEPALAGKKLQEACVLSKPDIYKKLNLSSPEETIKAFMAAAMRDDIAAAMACVIPHSHDYEDIKQQLDGTARTDFLKSLLSAADPKKPIKIVKLQIAGLRKNTCSIAWKFTLAKDWTSGKGPKKRTLKSGQTFTLDGTLLKIGEFWMIDGI